MLSPTLKFNRLEILTYTIQIQAVGIKWDLYTILHKMMNKELFVNKGLINNHTTETAT